MKRLTELKALKDTLEKQRGDVRDKLIEEYRNDYTEGQLIKERANDERSENIAKKANNITKNQRYLSEVEEQNQLKQVERGSGKED